MNSRRIKLMRMQLGFVFQGFNLWPHKTVLQNIIEAPIHVQKRSHQEAVAEAEALLQKSGYTKAQRVAVAALRWSAAARGDWRAQQPKAILFDEPTPRSTRSWWAKCARHPQPAEEGAP